MSDWNRRYIDEPALSPEEDDIEQARWEQREEEAAAKAGKEDDDEAALIRATESRYKWHDEKERKENPHDFYVPNSDFI